MFLINPYLFASDPVASWAARVVANGGAAPSVATQTAVRTFWTACQSAGIDTKIKTLNFFAPDSLTAAITPFIVGTGFDPWTNHLFVSGDLSVNGLKGDGASKYLATGLNPSANFTTTGGMTVCNVTIGAEGQQEMGCLAGNLNQVVEHNCFQCHVRIFDAHFCDCFSDGVTGRNSVAATGWTGYTSMNRSSTTSFSIFNASSTVAHTTAQTITGNNSAWTAPNKAMTVFCGVANDVGQFSFSSKILTLAAVHDFLTLSQSASFYTAFKNLRHAFGGVVDQGELPSTPQITNLSVSSDVDNGDGTRDVTVIWSTGKNVHSVATGMASLNGSLWDSLGAVQSTDGTFDFSGIDVNYTLVKMVTMGDDSCTFSQVAGVDSNQVNI